MSTREVTAITSFEVEVGLKGNYSPGCKAWGGSRFEPPINPPEDASIEDVECTSLHGLRVSADAGNVVWRRIDLLEGVDLKCPDVRKLLDNVAAFLHDDADDALMAEAQA